MQKTYHTREIPGSGDLGLSLHQVMAWIARHWQRLLLLGLALVILLNKDVAINLEMQGGPEALFARRGIPAAAVALPDREVNRATEASYPTEAEAETEAQAETEAEAEAEAEPSRRGLFGWLATWLRPRKAAVAVQDNAANRFTSFDFESDAAARPEERLSKRKRQLSYIDRYAGIAREERERYGIPVSITLAQGLLESDAGYSSLARKNNNHFGIKCFSKSCARGHCRNFSDDHHKDFFRIYASPRESYRAHSELLQKARYRSLKTLDPRDYRSWAKGLQQAGYATDPKYARKLIYLIETLGLDAYDQ